MLVTVSWIANNYDKFNKLYFDGTLPKINFKVSRSRKTWGYASFKYNLAKNTVTPTEITISNYYDSPEEVKLSTLLHEMIHIKDYTVNPHHYIKNSRKVRGYDAHGYYFISECERLKKYGWNISDKVTDEERLCSTCSERSKKLEQQKINTSIVVVIYGNNGYNWMIKTNDKFFTLISIAICNVDWNYTLNGVSNIKCFRITDRNLALKRSNSKNLSGWKYSNNELAHRLKEIGATEMKKESVEIMLQYANDKKIKKYA